jgi:group II intron reverse transcriptase/maturase
MVIKGKFSFGLTRRVIIPKPQGGERLLGIPEFQDRLVQEVLRCLLECVFEPRFLETSHGFRPGRSQHTTLRYIRRTFRGINWIIEGDIKRCFDRISHEIIIKLIRKIIKDEKFIHLLKKGLNTRVLMPNKQIEENLVGTPQGSIISPLLSNIVLQELDLFIERLKKIINRGENRRQNPEYSKLMKKVYKFKEEGNKKEAIKHRKLARKVGYKLEKDPNYLKLEYVRFADDFLVGIMGSKKLALKVRHLITKFLKIRLKLTLNLEKTKISRTKTEHIPFLGYLISYGPKKMHTVTRRYAGKLKTIKRLSGGNIRLLVDMNKVINKLFLKKFCDFKGRPIPNFHYFHNPQSFTVTRVSAVIRGLANYYHLANSKVSCIQRITYIIQHSLAKLFAAKFRLGTRAKVFKKAGRDLSKLIKSKATAYGATEEKLIK